MSAHKPKNIHLYTWETSRANRGSLCPQWRSDLFVGTSKALLCMEIRSDQSRRKEKTTDRSKMKISSAWGQTDQRKWATNQQIEGEPLTSIAKVSIASLMQLIQAPVEFDQLLENNMYATTSRCDDYPTSVKSQEAIKEVQSTSYQIFAGTNCSSDLSNTYRYKKGGYTKLMMEQIRNSQEDNQTDWNTNMKRCKDH
ncbi:uncharacterized protein [Miscanthus floridulus]|uniref:uncharacterized protein isoform X3 n=1 Tax=Miscanthus floridulus TaxID=154761 RepID=UPI003459B022